MYISTRYNVIQTCIVNSERYITYISDFLGCKLTQWNASQRKPKKVLENRLERVDLSVKFKRVLHPAAQSKKKEKNHHILLHVYFR
jgi:hypothetical protein